MQIVDGTLALVTSVAMVDALQTLQWPEVTTVNATLTLGWTRMETAQIVIRLIH